MSKRISFYGGPGSGKSTTAAWLFSELKTKNIPIELSIEYVKKWAYLKREVRPFDQIYLFGKQLQTEYLFLSSGKNIVTDSPPLLAAIYSDIYFPEMGFGKQITEIDNYYTKEFPSLNIFLERKDKPYDPTGRYQSHEQAKQIDEIIFNNVKNLISIPYDNRDLILSTTTNFLLS